MLYKMYYNEKSVSKEMDFFLYGKLSFRKRSYDETLKNHLSCDKLYGIHNMRKCFGKGENNEL